MFQGKKILALIPARGGSKGLPGKNLMKIFGKSMIEIAHCEAKKSAYIDRIVLSSEDNEIIAEAKRIGLEAPFIRPDHLSADNVSGNDVVEHALIECPGYDFIVLLQPTSPLRESIDIDLAIGKCICSGQKSCVSVTAVKKSPFWMYNVCSNGLLSPFLESSFQLKNRQAHPKLYVPNGAVYVAECSTFLKNKSFFGDGTIGYIMPSERSIDIDDSMDFLIAKTLMEKRKNRKNETTD